MLLRPWVEQGRTPKDFVRALRARYGDEDAEPSEPLAPSQFHWHKLLCDFAYLFRAAPGASCLLGPMDATAKVNY